MTERFAAVAAAAPDAEAVVQDGRALAYAELNAAAELVAARLRELGVGRGDIAGVAIARSPETIAAYIGVLKAGAAYLPIDPAHPDARIARLLADAGAVATVATPAGAERCAALGRGIPVAVLDGATTATTSPSVPREGPGPEDVAYVMYTSGSTGAPKGVAIPHRGILREALGSGYRPLGRGESVLGLNPLVFDGSVHDVYGPLLQGARLVLPPPGMPTPAVIRRLVQEQGITVLLAPAAIFHELVRAGLDGYEGVREFFVGGDVLSPRAVRACLQAVPGCVVHNSYGPTEATCDACSHPVADADAVGSSVPIGRPLPNTRAYVLDDELAPVAPGGAGELYVGGDGLARGYIGDPELTAERFVADPWVEGGRIYRTGDRVRLGRDGDLEFLGRLDDQVKIRGFRIEPAEVEAALRHVEGIVDAAVVARGEGSRRRLVAYVVGAGRDPDPDELARELAATLPAHLVPAAFVSLPGLPLSPNGKLDRGALPAPPAPAGAAEDETTSALERRLAGLWGELLGVERVAGEDDFFTLGGDSLLVMRLLARIAADEGAELSAEEVFARPTLSGMAAAIEERRAAAPMLLPPIERRRERFAPLSRAQERTWFLQRLEPTSRAYQFQDLVWLEGDLDRGALRRALQRLVRRHEILRTTFPWGDGGPLQVVHPPWKVRLPMVDLSELPESEREPALRDEAARRVGRVFDVTRLPLVRWRLYRLSPDRHALLHVEHHLVHDGWSWAVLRRELATLYADFAAGRSASLSAPAIQFTDFARWERTALTDEEKQRQLAYWRQRLQPPPPPLELPGDRRRPRRRSFAGGRLHADLTPGLTRAVRGAGTTTGTTPFMVMLAAFYELLRELTGEQDLCVGTGVANRRRRETEGLIGMVLNTAALRVDLAGIRDGRSLLRRVREAVVGALANQDIPFDRVVEELRPPREPGRMPLYDVLFSFDDSPRPPTRAGELRIVADEGLPNGSAKGDLNVIVVHDRGGEAGDGGFRLLWEYSADLLERETAERWLRRYLGILERLAADPDAALSRPRGAARDHAAPPAYERDATIAEVFARAARATPQAVALEHGERALTYDELERSANRLAHRLRAAGVGHETPVGVLMERSVELVVTILAVLKAGGAYVPLDPGYPRRRLELMIADGGLELIVTPPGLAGDLGTGAPDVVTLGPDLAVEGSFPDAPPVSEAGPESLAYVMYTSGSTGRPKAVEVLQRGVVRLVRGTDYADFGPGETFLALAPTTFDASTFEIWGALLNGGRLVVAPPGPVAFGELRRLIAEHGVTTLWLAAGLFHELVDADPDALAPVRQLLAGGDVISPAHVRRALEANPGLRVINGYGPTETTTFACTHEIRDPAELDGPVPIGRPIAHTAIRILDAAGQPVPAGSAGELHIGGDGLARGYRGRPDLTRERFVADPEDPSRRLYRTGDLVRERPDGALEFLGRIDDQVKVRGFRIEPGEIEAALLEHPAVASAAVVAHGADVASRRLAAFLVPAGDALEDPLPWLAERLPAHMVPARCEWRESLPLTPNGKLDRAALAQAAERSLAAGGAGEGGVPATETEQRLAAVWERLLGRPVARDDDFFALGGHSLMTLRLAAEIEREFHRELPVAAVFEAPTLAGLARLIDQTKTAAATESRSLVPIAPEGHKTPFFCVHGLGGHVAIFARLGRALDPERPFYGLQSVGFDGGRPLGSIEKMAARYIRELRTVQPRGPYLIGGMCFGAKIAFEMAQQLQASGDEVALVVILDARPAGQGGWKAGAARNGSGRPRGVRPLLRRGRRRARQFGNRLLRRTWHERRRAAKRFADPRRRTADRRVWRRNAKAGRHYVMRPYAGAVALFESAASAKDESRREGWAGLTGGAIDHRVVPGTHRSMLRDPHVQALAASLAERLDATDARDSAG